MPINFENVYYVYNPKTPFSCDALNGINLEIKDGSFTCIVGHTGCGKSTLIQQINGLLEPTSGTVKVKDFVISPDRKIRTKKLSNLRKIVGIVFQSSEYQLFDETVEEDVCFGPMNFGVKKEEALKTAHECLKIVGLNESFYKKSPFELSGGEKRKVAIAGILALKPQYLILDEPTAGLDPDSSKAMLKLFKKLNENGTTIIVVTHDMNIVFEYADDVIVMDGGKVVKHTSPNDLFFEDVEQYSLDTPNIVKVVRLFKEKGIDLNLGKIKDVDSLVSAILEARSKK